MSDIALVGENIPLKKVKEKLRTSEKQTIQHSGMGSLNVVIATVGSERIWGIGKDPNTGVTVAVGGRPVFGRRAWKKADDSSLGGGLISRIIIDRYLSSSLRKIKHDVNGRYAIVVWDPGTSICTVVTDKMGIFPLYYSEGKGVHICSHADVLADIIRLDDQRKPPSIDPITGAEAICRSESVHPHSFYEEVKQLDPASAYAIDQKSIRQSKKLELRKEEEYWKPSYLKGEVKKDKEKLIDRLARAFKSAIKRRSHSMFDNIGVMLSGGIDSRAVFLGLDNPSQAHALTYVDNKSSSEDWKIAKKLTSTVGAEHTPLLMNRYHYLEKFKESVGVGAGMWSIATDHIMPFIKKIKEIGLDVLLSGCYCDYMFKGLADNLKNKSLFGLKLRQKKIASFDYEYYYGHHNASEKMQSKIESRWKKRYRKCIVSEIPKSIYHAENLRLRPMSREADIMGRFILMRYLPWNLVISDNDILNVYEEIPISIKSNPSFFREVVQKVTPKWASSVELSGINSRIGQSFYGTIMRKIYLKASSWFSKSSRKRSTQASARSLNRLVESLESEDSPVGRCWRNCNNVERDYFEYVLGYDPWEKNLKYFFSGNKHLLFRIVTHYVWIKQRNAL